MGVAVVGNQVLLMHVQVGVFYPVMGVGVLVLEMRVVMSNVGVHVSRPVMDMLMNMDLGVGVLAGRHCRFLPCFVC